MAGTQKSTGGKTSTKRTSKGFSAEERAAMKERARELKAGSGEAEVLAKIAELPKADRVMAEKFHAIVKAAAPSLEPRTWYGMPAYAMDGKVMCFFTPASKFKERYATFGFNAPAKLDAGSMWPTSFALTELDAAAEKKITQLVKKAVS